MQGTTAEVWLTSLNDNIALCEERWKLKVQPPFGLSFYSLIKGYCSPFLFLTTGKWST